MVVLPLVLLVAALAIATTGLGSTGAKHAKAAGPITIGKGGGFGEIYRAKVSTLAKTLFQARLLPVTPAARNTFRCSSRNPLDDLNETITIPASALFANPARRALSAGLSVALTACARTAEVRVEFGVSQNPAPTANNNRRVSALLNRFLL